MGNNYTELDEREQKEFIFQIDSRLRYIDGFYDKVADLIKNTEPPFSVEGITQVLKSEYNTNS